MLEKIQRGIFSFLARKTEIFNLILRSKVRSRLKILHLKLETKEKEARHKKLLATDPLYRNRFKIRELLRSIFIEFTDLATAHYNEQLDTLCSKDEYKYYASTCFEEELSLAEDYLNRNRSRLFEWWCLYGNGRKKFLDEYDLVRIELGYSFDEIFSEKMKTLFDITVMPDKNHYNGGISVIQKDTDIPNEYFMERVLSRIRLKWLFKNLLK